MRLYEARTNVMIYKEKENFMGGRTWMSSTNSICKRLASMLRYKKDLQQGVGDAIVVVRYFLTILVIHSFLVIVVIVHALSPSDNT